MFAVGLMSGTSADGLSVALADFKGSRFQLIAYQTFPYPSSLSKLLLRLTTRNAPVALSEIAFLNRALGEFFADRTVSFLKKTGVSFKKIAAIGSHGHTIFHGPRGQDSATFQIGEPSFLAEKTGIPVVSDFRQRDIAAGGEGGPLVPFFDEHFFGQGPATACQNIGGIANVTLVGKKLKRPMAFDNGPGNCLIDEAMGRNGRFRFDKNGEVAARGRIQFELVKKWMRHPYFAKQPPKSIGRELFRLERFCHPEPFGARHSEPFDPRRHPERSEGSQGKLREGSRRSFGPSGLRMTKSDLVATLTYFTAFSIAESYRRFFPTSPERIIVSGGGVKNRTLMRHLQTLLAPIPVESIEDHGLPAQAKEPVAFAYFALCAIRGKVNHLAHVTGARSPRILGKIIQ